MILVIEILRTNATHEENLAELVNDGIAYAVSMIILGLVHFVTGMIAIDLLNYTALKQVTRIRLQYFQSLLRQNIGWFDVSKANNIAVRMTG